MVVPNYHYSLRNNPEERSSEASVCREMIAVCSDIHAEHINVLCGQNVNTQWHFKPCGVHHVLTRYWRSSRRGFNTVKTKIILPCTHAKFSEDRPTFTQVLNLDPR
jgi:hypothetical protein